jgi:large subunit ribosomal protein L17
MSFLQSILRNGIKADSKQTPHELIPKLFGDLRRRYETRPGGYTRVLRIEPLKPDMAPSAILELVDGYKDIRFQMTARTVAKEREEGRTTLRPMTLRNIDKVTRFRPGGEKELEGMVEKFADLEVGERNNGASEERRWGGDV